ncbi:cytochrome c oxidase assembly protein [Niveispirillum irakense]|uniref:cytochrome c oxidase assembly protein n=1 Tax=Niveispirillum irakense TaxID=34011 RepID=UPI00041EF927|nr:cytochrome c oxidase assembly protein [Niveispirillum irakense]
MAGRRRVREIIIAGLALALVPLPAFAHAGGIWIGPDALSFGWSLLEWIALPLLVCWWLYGRGIIRLWGRAGVGRGIDIGQVCCFAAGMILLVLALLSPIDALGETLFTAHMTQHMLLLVVAPPLLLLGRPDVAFTAGLPAGWRGSAAWLHRQPGRWLAPLVGPGTASLIKAVILWGWHAPPLFDAALLNDPLHELEHACFLLAGLLFWWALLRPGRDVLASLQGAGAALVTLIHSGMLGALLTLAPVPLYASYVGQSELWGLTVLEDQQLAGLVMWVPMGFVYLGAGLALAAPALGGRRSRA